MNDREKEAAIEGQIEHFSQTPLHFGIVYHHEITGGFNLGMEVTFSAKRLSPTNFTILPGRGSSTTRRPMAPSTSDEPYMEIQLGPAASRSRLQQEWTTPNRRRTENSEKSFGAA